MTRIKIILSLFLFISAITLNAQQFGGFPHRTKWKQIDTDTARIIFSQGAEFQAARIATVIHRAAADTHLSPGSTLRKINIVLHNRTTLANGYVGLAPFRSEFYLVPGSDIFDNGNLPWQDQLALHEYRHVQQYNHYRKGLSKAFYYLFGERGLVFANAVAVPDWFFEGDAVHAETALSPQGRGRLAYFQSGYRSLWQDNRKYSWQKLRNGSLKDYVPDHYQLGYLLVNYGYEKYGADFWEKVTADASAFRGVFYPFQHAIKKYSGVTYKTFRKDAMQYYTAEFPDSLKKQPPQDKRVTQYYFPRYINEDSLVYLKTAFNKIPSFFIRDGAGEHKIAVQHISSEKWFSYRRGLIAYTAYSTNPRWSLIDNSDVVILDILSGKQQRITSGAKYFTPDLSPSAEKILVVHMNDSLQTDLKLLNRRDGSVPETIRAEEDQFFINPLFVDERRIVTGIRLNDARMSLNLYDLDKKEWQTLIPPSIHTIGLPSVSGDTVFFTANFFGNDDIYAVMIGNKKLFRLTRSFTGNYYPSYNGRRLVYSSFRSNGLKLMETPVDETEWTPVEISGLQRQVELFPVAEANNIFDASVKRYSVKRYSRATRLFNFHSWSPDYVDPEFTLTVYGNNILNTFASNLYYRYNDNEDSHGFGWNASYGAFFPMINAGAEYTYKRHLSTSTANLLLNQFEARLGYNMPFDFTRGKTYKFLNLGSDVVLNKLFSATFKDSLKFEASRYLFHFVNWSQYRQRALQQIYPKLGYVFSGAYRHLLGGKGYQGLAAGNLFLPSFGNHSIVLSAAVQETDTSNTIFANRFANSRGYTDYYFSRMWKLGGNYHFPIVYPDFGIASIVYFRRVRGNLFYDYTRVYSGDKKAYANLRSTGAEIYFDTRWWNQYPLSFGFRVSRLLDNGFNSFDRKGKTYVQFILPLDLIPD